MLQHEVLEGSFVAILDEEEQRAGTFLGVDILQNIGVSNFSQEVDLLQKRVCGDHGRIAGDFLHGKHGVDVRLSGFIIA